MNGNDHPNDHERRLTRVEVSSEYIVKRLDDLERRMDGGFQGVRNEMNARFRELQSDMDAGFRDHRRGTYWLAGFSCGTLLAIQLATLGLLMRAQHLL